MSGKPEIGAGQRGKCAITLPLTLGASHLRGGRLSDDCKRWRAEWQPQSRSRLLQPTQRRERANAAEARAKSLMAIDLFSNPTK